MAIAMIQETYYKKVGKRYVPVSYYDSNLTHSLKDGCTLIVKNKGATAFITKDITPDNVAMLAAMVYAREALISAMHKTCEARPGRAPISEEEQQAWENLKKAMGDSAYYILYPSLHEIAEKATENMRQQAEQLLTNEAVRNAYEHFLLLAKLSKDE
jgi:hypothetical protein